MGAFATRRDVVVEGLIGILIGALLTGAIVTSRQAGAADGDDMLLGSKNYTNQVKQIEGKGGVRFWNTTKSGEPAAWFRVYSGPPFAVSSTEKAENLTADLLDGLSAGELSARWHRSSIADIADGTNWLPDSKNMYVDPGGAALLMTGFVTFYNGTVSPIAVDCCFEVDDTEVIGSRMTAYAQPSQTATCSTAASKVEGTVGMHAVEFITDGMASAGIEGRSGSYWVIGLRD